MTYTPILRNASAVRRRYNCMAQRCARCVEVPSTLCAETAGLKRGLEMMLPHASNYYDIRKRRHLVHSKHKSYVVKLRCLPAA